MSSRRIQGRRKTGDRSGGMKRVQLRTRRFRLNAHATSRLVPCQHLNLIHFLSLSFQPLHRSITVNEFTLSDCNQSHFPVPVRFLQLGLDSSLQSSASYAKYALSREHAFHQRRLLLVPLHHHQLCIKIAGYRRMAPGSAAA